MEVVLKNLSRFPHRFNFCRRKRLGLKGLLNFCKRSLFEARNRGRRLVPLSFEETMTEQNRNSLIKIHNNHRSTKVAAERDNIMLGARVPATIGRKTAPPVKRKELLDGALSNNSSPVTS